MTLSSKSGLRVTPSSVPLLPRGREAPRSCGIESHVRHFHGIGDVPEVSADTKIGANRPLAGPPPNLVPYNDWQTLEVPPIDSFKPNMAVSVVVPYFQAPEELGRTLATLERQTYPRDLFEVVVVDDGSREPLQWPKNTPLNLTVVHQENRGFGAARARNTGARAAKHDILVFLDCDMLAEAGLLTAHARWHHVVSDAITQGFYSRVAVEAIHAEAIRKTSGSIKNLLGGPFDPPSKERFMSRTADLMSKKDNLYQIASSGNLGVAKPFFESIGGYDESFTRYGREDTEFVYRAYIQGALLVPARDAFAWHQGEWEAESETKRDSWSRHGKAVNLIAHHSFRPASPGRIFAVPRYVVSIRADSEPIEQVAQATESILADTEFDLVVRIEVSATRHSDQVNWLEEHFGPDPRVRVAPTSHALDQFPASPFHVTAAAGRKAAKRSDTRPAKQTWRRSVRTRGAEGRLHRDDRQGSCTTIARDARASPPRNSATPWRSESAEEV